MLADRGSSVIDQLTFADFLNRGEFDRHLRRMRPVYRRRRDALLAALRTRLPDLEPVGVAAGQHVVAWLPHDLDEATVVAAAAQHGLNVQGVSPYRLRPAGPGGLIFGYATLTERAITDGVGALADAVADVQDSQNQRQSARGRLPVRRVVTPQNAPTPYHRTSLPLKASLPADRVRTITTGGAQDKRSTWSEE